MKEKVKYPPKICSLCLQYIPLGEPLYMYMSQTFCSKKCRNYFCQNDIKFDYLKIPEIIDDNTEDPDFDTCYLQ